MTPPAINPHGGPELVAGPAVSDAPMLLAGTTESGVGGSFGTALVSGVAELTATTALAPVDLPVDLPPGLALARVPERVLALARVLEPAASPVDLIGTAVGLGVLGVLPASTGLVEAGLLVGWTVCGGVVGRRVGPGPALSCVLDRLVR